MALEVRIVDTWFGMPAADLDVLLSCCDEDGWQEVVRGRTDSNGVLVLPLAAEGRSRPAAYRIECDLEAYYAVLGAVPFFARLTVDLRLPEQEERLSLPLVISPQSVVAYRGA